MNIQTIRDMANTVRGRRVELGLSQHELAVRAGVSRKWIYEFESGKQGAQLRSVLRVVDALRLTLALNPREDPLQATGDEIDLDVLLNDYQGG